MDYIWEVKFASRLQAQHLKDVQVISTFSLSLLTHLTIRHSTLRFCKAYLLSSAKVRPRPTKMQFSLSTAIITVLGGASIVHAGVADGSLVPRANCRYRQSDTTSACIKGEDMFCTGNVKICEGVETSSYDETATSANEVACSGFRQGQKCLQTVMCCGS